MSINRSSFFRPNSGRPEAGYTLVGVLVLVGVIGILVLAIGQLISNTKRIQATLNSKQLYRDVEKQMVYFIGGRFLDSSVGISATGNCVNFSTLFPASQFAAYSKTFNFHASSKSASSDLTSALTRCSSPTMPANATDATQGFFNLCLQPVKQGLSIGAASNANCPDTTADERMIEVQVRLEDVATHDLISCADFYTRKNASPKDTSAAMYIWVRLYWENTVGCKTSLRTHESTYIVNGEN